MQCNRIQYLVEKILTHARCWNAAHLTCAYEWVAVRLMVGKGKGRNHGEGRGCLRSESTVFMNMLHDRHIKLLNVIRQCTSMSRNDAMDVHIHAILQHKRHVMEIVYLSQ